MYKAVNGCSLSGIVGKVIKVETDISNGIPQFEIVGLPDASVKEAKGRVRAAIKNCGWEFPAKRITINLAPSNLPKGGSQLDLAIAVSILSANDSNLSATTNLSTVYLGELSLDGRVCGVDGVLPMALKILEAGFQRLILPRDNYEEVEVLEHKLSIIPVTSLSQLLKSECDLDHNLTDENSVYFPMRTEHEDDKSNNNEGKTEMTSFSDIYGQKQAKRALEIAVAGMHNILLIGPPGTGKTMLASSVASIMPEMTFEESLEVSKIYSASGCLNNYASSGLISVPPVRMPHHTITEAALIGGGKNPRPGEISLAHRGVLVLDEMSEFSQRTLDLLRQPLEDGKVVISRSQNSCVFPANFMLVATTNPCPCGYYTAPDKLCTCSPWQLKTYLGKISGALWDRIDIQIEVPQMDYQDLTTHANWQKRDETKFAQERVISARKQQFDRFQNSITTNSMINSKYLYQHCEIDLEAIEMLEKMYTKLGMSIRGHDKILKIARTIADLEKRENICVADIAEAANYRGLDRKYL